MKLFKIKTITDNIIEIPTNPDMIVFFILFSESRYFIYLYMIDAVDGFKNKDLIEVSIEEYARIKDLMQKEYRAPNAEIAIPTYKVLDCLLNFVDIKSSTDNMTIDELINIDNVKRGDNNDM